MVSSPEIRPAFAVVRVTALSAVPMSAVQQMKKRAGEEEQPGQSAEKMGGPVLGQQKESGNREKEAEHETGR